MFGLNTNKMDYKGDNDKGFLWFLFRREKKKEKIDSGYLESELDKFEYDDEDYYDTNDDIDIIQEYEEVDYEEGFEEDLIEDSDYI